MKDKREKYVVKKLIFVNKILKNSTL